MKCLQSLRAPYLTPGRGRTWVSSLERDDGGSEGLDVLGRHLFDSGHVRVNRGDSEGPGKRLGDLSTVLKVQPTAGYRSHW